MNDLTEAEVRTIIANPDLYPEVKTILACKLKLRMKLRNDLKMNAAEVRTILANPTLFSPDVYREAKEATLPEEPAKEEIANGQV